MTQLTRMWCKKRPGETVSMRTDWMSDVRESKYSKRATIVSIGS